MTIPCLKRKLCVPVLVILYIKITLPGVPMDFEERYLTELYARRSDTLEDVVDSVKRNGVCLKGILATPDHSSDGELKTLNMKLRWGDVL